MFFERSELFEKKKFVRNFGNTAVESDESGIYEVTNLA